MSASRKLLLADFSYSDVDRLNSFLEAAERNGRRLIVTPRHAHLIEELAEMGLMVPRISASKFGVYRKSKRRFYGWEKELFEAANVLEAGDVAEAQKEVILASSFFDIRDLIEVKPKPGSNFILSTSEPFNEEQAVEYGKLLNWLDHFGLPMFSIHCSGHAQPFEIEEMVSQVRPRLLLPIHSEHPNLLSRYISDTVKVQRLVKGVGFEVG